MTDDISRRDILTSSAAAAVSAALPSLGHVSPAMAQSIPSSAAEIVAAIRAKKITATAVTKAAIERAEQMKDLNAFIFLNKDGALATAAEIDEGRTGPLAGLPIVIKDNINTIDLPTSGGTPALHGVHPRTNAPSFDTLFKAGTVGLRPSVGNGGAQRRYHDANMVVPISHTRDTVGPMGRTVADVALLDSVITGTQMASPEPLRGKRLGIPASFWSGLDRDVEAVARAAREKLADAGVVLVDADMAGLFEQNGKVSFVVALHEPIADIPAYLQASGIEGITLADIAGKIASPDVQGAFGAITADAFGAAYQDAITVQRPALQKIYETYFRDNSLDGMLFPTTIAPAPVIDVEKGSGEMSINGEKPVPTFDTMIRNTDPGSNAGLPGLSLFAGMTPGGLPVGLEIDGPVGSDAKLLRLGLSIEGILGSAPPPKM